MDIRHQEHKSCKAIKEVLLFPFCFVAASGLDTLAVSSGKTRIWGKFETLGT